MEEDHFGPHLGADEGPHLVEQMLLGGLIKGRKPQMLQNQRAVPPDRGFFVVTGIKNPRQIPKLAGDIVRISRMELAGKEPFGRLEIAQGQHKANRIGGGPEGRQQTLQRLGEVKEPLAFHTAEEWWGLEGSIFRRCEDGDPWHYIPLGMRAKRSLFRGRIL